jgi:hypothetical protein
MTDLGLMYEQGRGVPQDFKKRIAGSTSRPRPAEDDNTRESATRNRGLVAKTMSRDDVAKAQAMAPMERRSLTRSSATAPPVG